MFNNKDINGDNMYNKLNNVDKYNGQELIEALIYVCNNIGNHALEYYSSTGKVHKTLTKLCINIREEVYSDIDVVYIDDNDETTLEYMCNTYGYDTIIYACIDTSYDYWYIMDNELHEGMYGDIEEYSSYFLPTDTTIYNAYTDIIRFLIKHYWDKIDYNYGGD